jgi:hypothetical protein
MAFAERYNHALVGNLQDDEHHNATSVLSASALADRSARDIGALLHRVKYASAAKQAFESGNHELATLCKAWLAIVTDKGSARKWVKSEDVSIAPILYRRVADASLAYYLDSTCKECSGTGTQGAAGCYKTCLTCKGSKRAELPAMRAYEKHRVLEMVDELTALEHTHAGVASVKLRREV